MATFSERDAALDAIAAIMARQSELLQQIKATAQSISSALAALPTTYADEIADINSEATGNPNDTAIQNHKAKLDQFTIEFQASKTLADQIVAAIN